MQPPNVNVLAWPRMSSSEFGCYMEQTLGHQDKRFNCSLKNYENQGDPCTNTDAYYEGPILPANLATRVHPLAREIELSWEHGELQQVTVTLEGTLSEAEVRNAFELPLATNHPSPETAQRLPENVMDAQVEYPLEPINSSPGKLPGTPSPGLTSIVLTGFDHMGAGDVDCDAEQ